jgi:hypothetical protein
MYSSDGERWWRTEWEPQCEAEIVLAGRCQGTAGHDDVHWAYQPDGSFAWDDNDDDPRHDGAAGWTPPGHKEYRTPESMQEHLHQTFRTCEEITDPELIKRLEDDDPPEGDDCSIAKPLSEDDPFYEEAQERLEDYRKRSSGED